MQLKRITSNLVLLCFFSVMLISCSEKDEETTVIGKVAFNSEDLIEVEGSNLPLGVNLGVNTYNHNGGRVHVEVTGGNYGADYTLSTGSDSFDIEIAKGSQLATFTVSTINDDAVESNVELTFTITNVSGGLELGNDSEFKLNILNDDTPEIGTISFTNPTYQFNEDDTSDKVISFSFNQASTFGGTITLNATGNAVYGSDYTVQGQTSGNFTITVPPLSNTAQFIVNSVDDIVADNTKNVTFTIVSVTGGLQFQSPNTTAISFVDNDIIPIPINYVETFEGNTGSNYLTNTLGYTVQTINQSANITTLMSANTAAASYSDVNNVATTSDNGVNLFHNATSSATPSLLGDLDQILISPNQSANGNVTFSIDYNHGFTAQNNAIVTFYWSETYTSGAFNPAQWTELGSDSATAMISGGTAVNVFKRRTFSINPINNFRIAVRVTQNINATNYRTRWRFDNIKLNN